MVKDKNSDELVTKADLMATEVELKVDMAATKADLKASLRPLKKKLDLIISFFDGEVTNHGKRIKPIETHLNLPPMAN